MFLENVVERDLVIEEIEKVGVVDILLLCE